MKLTAKKYAQALAQTMTEGKHNPKDVARNFLNALMKHGQTKLLPAILDQLELEWARSQGMHRVEVEYAPKFKDAMEVIEKALTHSGKFLVKSKPREDLIGGYRLKIEDTMIDASLSGRLNQLAAQMKK